MNGIWNPNIELFDIDSRNIRHQEIIDRSEQNGILLCKHGNITLMLDEQLYRLQAGDLYIYPSFTQTYVHSFSQDLQGVVGMADFDFVLSSLDSISDTQSHVYIRFHPHVSLTAVQYNRIEELIECIRKRKDIHTGLSTQVVSALVQAFCYEVIDAYIANTTVRPTKQTRKDKIFQNFLIALYHNFQTHRNVQFYAGLQNLTPRYFATLVREVSGKTPLQWITLFVIIAAKRLLSDPNTSIKETAVKLNFTEQSFFGRYFKLYAGCSPSEYKSRSLGK